MARMNVSSKRPTVFTHEGGRAVPNLTSEQMLRRSVMSCLLWENEFYEDGQKIADRIVAFAEKVSLEYLAGLIGEARNRFHLRHVPLLLAVVMARRGRGQSITANAIESAIGRVDELAEFANLYWQMNPDKMLSRKVRQGLAKAFAKFDRYQFAKYDFDKGKTVKLRDVLRLARPKPANDEQSLLYKAIRENALEASDTWETALMTGADKKETFERLINEGRLGYLALLRNLRKMQQSNVDTDLIKAAIIARKGARFVWPFRYVAAARAAPQFEASLDQALIEAIGDMPVLSGKTVVLVDVSGSMDAKMSGKSDLDRIDAAATLASIIPGDLRVFTFSNRMVEVPARRGMAGVDVIKNSQDHQGTDLGGVIALINAMTSNNGLGGKVDRVIVITDEQSRSAVPDPLAKYAYMINVASNENGVGYRRWTHIDGFADSVLRFIHEIENDGQRTT